MGKLLRDVELLGTNYQRRQEDLDKARRALRESMGKAHEEGISMALAPDLTVAPCWPPPGASGSSGEPSKTVAS